MQTTKTILALLLCATLLGACGLRGPLYLPGEEPPEQPASEQAGDDGSRSGGAGRG